MKTTRKTTRKSRKTTRTSRKTTLRVVRPHIRVVIETDLKMKKKYKRYKRNVLLRQDDKKLI